MWCRFLSAESHSDANEGKVPDFDDWVETDAWRTVEGHFVGIGVLPQIVVAGCAPPAIGSAAARAAAVRASPSRSRTAAEADGAWLTWVFSHEGGDDDDSQSTITRSELEELQSTYSPGAVGKHTTESNDDSSGQDNSVPQLWNEERVVAFSIECQEQVRAPEFASAIARHLCQMPHCQT